MLIPSSVLYPAGQKYINSIQQVSITITAGTSGTATISAVGANAFLIFQGYTATGTGTDAATSATKVVLTNSTTVTATINSTGSVVVNCVVIDPTSSLVTGVQAGTITIPAGSFSHTATITSVDMNLSAIFYLGQTNTQTTEAVFENSQDAAVEFKTSTSVEATVGAQQVETGQTVTASYVVVTFAAAALQSNIQHLQTIIRSGTSNTQTITSVNTANTMLAWGGTVGFSAGTETLANLPWIKLTASTTVTLTSSGAGTYDCWFKVIEFVPGVLNSVQRGSIAISSSTSNTATITSVDTAKAFCSFQGETGAGTTDATTLTKVALTNATTVTASVKTSASPTTGYEVIEFTN